MGLLGRLLVGGLVVLAAGCGLGDADDGVTVEADPSVDVATEDSGVVSAECEQIADDGIDGINEVLAQYEDKTLEDLAEGEGELPPDLQARFDSLDERAAAANCDEDDVDDLLAQRVDDIEGSGFLADLVRSALEEQAEQ
jgi:hypothetical protein